MADPSTLVALIAAAAAPPSGPRARATVAGHVARTIAVETHSSTRSLAAHHRAFSSSALAAQMSRFATIKAAIRAKWGSGLGRGDRWCRGALFGDVPGESAGVAFLVGGGLLRAFSCDVAHFATVVTLFGGVRSWLCALPSNMAFLVTVVAYCSLLVLAIAGDMSLPSTVVALVGLFLMRTIRANMSKIATVITLLSHASSTKRPVPSRLLRFD